MTMRPLNEIIVHCTATPNDWLDGRPTSLKVQSIRNYHVKSLKWRDIGYHYLIDRDGTVAVGRPLEQVGSHVRGRNTGTIGIALFGGATSREFMKFHDNYTPAQDKALRNLIRQLIAKHGPMAVNGHNQYAAKACPGFHAPSWYSETA